MEFMGSFTKKNIRKEEIKCIKKVARHRLLCYSSRVTIFSLCVVIADII